MFDCEKGVIAQGFCKMRPELECMFHSVIKCVSSHILSANKLVSFHPLSQGPFVHVASLCAALLSKFMAAVFGGIFMVRMVAS